MDSLISDELNIINPKEISISYSEKPFSLNITIFNQTSYENILAIPAFPLSASHVFIHLYERSDDGGLGKLIGIIEDIEQLSKDSCLAIKLLLKKISHIPLVSKVTNIIDEYHYFHWYIETDRGAVDFFMGTPRRYITPFNQNSLLIKDLKGDMYHIADLTALDKKSQELINLVY